VSECSLALYQNKRVLITGGLGFIGSTLARRLVGLGANVVLVDAVVPETGANRFNIDGIAERLRCEIADIQDERVMRECLPGQQIIFNLAGRAGHARSMQQPVVDLEGNCRCHLALLESCRRLNPDARLVFTSSRQVYGRVQQLPVDETQPPAPTDLYSIHKMATERYHSLYARAYQMRSVILRLSNTYGPRMPVGRQSDGVLGWFIRQLLDGDALRVFGNGRQQRDPVFVDDVVEVLLRVGVCDAADGEVFNIAGGEVVSVRDLAQTLLDVAGKPGRYRMVPFPAEQESIDVGSVFLDCAKIYRVLDWRPRVRLREGLARTLAFYEEHGSHYWPLPRH